MPLQIFSASEAFDNMRNEVARWPRKPEQQARRLTGIAKPTFTPSFQLSKDDRIFTIGSCFARNIEAHLAQLGMNVAAADLSFPEHLRVSGPDGAALMNKFVVMSIENELRWALEPGASFPEETLWEVEPHRFKDPHLSGGLPPQSREHVLERRQLITDWFRTITQSRLVVITLGLAEAWYDRNYQTYFNMAPLPAIRKTRGGELELHLLSYDDILASLNRIHALLSEHLAADWKLLITVSPVAMGGTFSNRDALVANTYSKSVQRAAVEAFVRSHHNIDYFPSYESIVLSDRSLAYEEDQAHVASGAVRSNVIRMTRQYVDPEYAQNEDDSEARALDILQQAFAAEKNGDYSRALGLYEIAAEGSSDPDVLLRYGQCLLNMKQPMKSAEILKRAKLNGAGRLGVNRPLAKALYGSGQIAEAESVIAEALEKEPRRPGVLNLAAKIKFDLGKVAEARQLAMRSIDSKPDNVAAARLIEKCDASGAEFDRQISGT